MRLQCGINCSFILPYCLPEKSCGIIVERFKDGGECGVQELRECMIDISRQLGDKMEVCAYVADLFFSLSNLKNYKKLIASADEAGVVDDVRISILKFLETDILPWKEKKNRWPLPIVENVMSRRRADLPIYWLLVEIALDENRLSDAVRFYHLQGNPGTHSSWFLKGTEGDQGWIVPTMCQRNCRKML